MAGHNYPRTRAGAGIPQTGYRYPKHLGARVQQTESITVLCAMPILAGESLVRAEIDMHWVSQADEAADQLHEVHFGLSAHPWEWASDLNTADLSAANLDSMITAAMGTPGDFDWAPDPNPGADTAWQGPLDAGFGAHEVIDTKDTWAKARQFALDDTLIGGDQMVNRTEASWRKVVTKNHYYAQDMVLLLWVGRGDASAQTDFGVAEMDQSADEENLFLALERGLAAGQSGVAQHDKIVELLYGGDRYTEADTIKSTTGVGYGMIANTIATPWPVTIGD